MIGFDSAAVLGTLYLAGDTHLLQLPYDLSFHSSRIHTCFYCHGDRFTVLSFSYGLSLLGLSPLYNDASTVRPPAVQAA